MTDAPTCVFRANAIDEAKGEFSHPWNARSKLIGTHLSKLAGLKRAGISLVRVPAGFESFTFHRHHFEEEWVYVLDGRAIAEIDDTEHEIGPGDFLAFHAGGPAHHLRNPFDTDLVYLMGGENREFEVADFPRLNRRIVRRGRHAEIAALDGFRPFP